MIVRSVPSVGSGYWDAHSPKSPSPAKSLVGRLGIGKREQRQMLRPPSWHDEYFSQDLSVKGGQFFAPFLGKGDKDGSAESVSSDGTRTTYASSIDSIDSLERLEV